MRAKAPFVFRLRLENIWRDLQLSPGNVGPGVALPLWDDAFLPLGYDGLLPLRYHAGRPFVVRANGKGFRGRDGTCNVGSCSVDVWCHRRMVECRMERWKNVRFQNVCSVRVQAMAYGRL